MFLKTHVERRDHNTRPSDQLIRKVGTRAYASDLRGIVASRLTLFYGASALAFNEQHEVGIKPVQHDARTDDTGSRLDVELKCVKTKTLLAKIAEPASIACEKRKHCVDGDEPIFHPR